MPQMKCLVLGSCTGQKDDLNCPAELKLKEEDFTESSRLLGAEDKAKCWLKPAGEMYTGRQHTLMMSGVRQLVGYLRVSSLGQKELRQLEGITLDKRFVDKASGNDLHLPSSNSSSATVGRTKAVLFEMRRCLRCKMPPLLLEL